MRAGLKIKSKTEAGNVAQVKGLPSKCRRLQLEVKGGGADKEGGVRGRHFSSTALPLALPGDNVKCQVAKGLLVLSSFLFLSPVLQVMDRIFLHRSYGADVLHFQEGRKRT